MHIYTDIFTIQLIWLLRYVWNLGKKCEDDTQDDIWCEWEATKLKVSTFNTMPSSVNFSGSKYELK